MKRSRYGAGLTGRELFTSSRLTALFTKPPVGVLPGWNHPQGPFQPPALFTAYGSFRNCTRQNHGTVGNREAGGFVNSAVTVHNKRYEAKYGYCSRPIGALGRSRVILPSCTKHCMQFHILVSWGVGGLFHRRRVVGGTLATRDSEKFERTTRVLPSGYRTAGSNVFTMYKINPHKLFQCIFLFTSKM